jgi:hypothetical protein
MGSMGRAAEPTALADIAGAAGLGMSDVAFTAGLDESTISRLWTDPHWLDRITGASLQHDITVPVLSPILARKTPGRCFVRQSLVRMCCARR